MKKYLAALIPLGLINGSADMPDAKIAETVITTQGDVAVTEATAVTVAVTETKIVPAAITETNAVAAAVTETPIISSEENKAPIEQLEPAKLGETDSSIKNELVEIKPFEVKFVLTVPEKEGKMIEEIIVTMGTNNVLSLGFKKGHLKELGKQLKGLGPLQFLGYIFSHPKLKAQMRSIYKSSFKWKGFVDGMVPGLARDSADQKFYEDLKGFAKHLNVDYETLANKAKSQDWEAFVLFILDNTA